MKINCSHAIGMLVLGMCVAPWSVYAQNGPGNELNHGQDKPADGRGNRTRDVPPGAPSGGSVTTGNGISYHGGPVLQAVNVYYIWYGDWSQDPKANAILTNFAQHVGGSPYFNINTTYGDATANVPNVVSYVTSYSDPSSGAGPGSQGPSLSDSSIAAIVSNALSSGALGPADPNGVYFVLTAPGVNETSGFLTKYCGWHTAGTLNNGITIQYAFVGDAAGPSLGNCAEQTSSSPNNDPGADAMVSVVAHELEESATDPHLNAWYDSQGAENADKCAWTFGTTSHASNGSLFNMALGGLDYLIQRNWVNAGGGYCALSYTTSTPDFSVSATPSSRSIPQGTGTTYTATVTPSGGFTGLVTFGVSGLPAGASASFSPASVTTSGSSTLSVSTSTPAGTYALTITGTGGGLSHSALVSLTVTAPSNFGISVSPTSTTITRGSNGSVTVSTSGSGSTVALSLSGLPPRTSASFNPSSVAAGGKSTLTITTNKRTPTGTYPLTITGSNGTNSHPVSLSLTITN